MLWTRQSLITRMAAGDHVVFHFLFFWGHTPKEDGRVDQSCLSQAWHQRLPTSDVIGMGPF